MHSFLFATVNLIDIIFSSPFFVIAPREFIYLKQHSASSSSSHSLIHRFSITTLNLICFTHVHEHAYMLTLYSVAVRLNLSGLMYFFVCCCCVRDDKSISEAMVDCCKALTNRVWTSISSKYHEFVRRE